MLNRETSIMLILVYLFYRYDELPFSKLFSRLSIFTLVASGVYLSLRKIYGLKEYYCDIYWANFNLSNPNTYIYLLLLFSVFIFLAWQKFKQKPKFLVRSARMIPFFLFIHWIIGICAETRLFLPLVPIVFPLALFSLFESKKEFKKEDKEFPTYATGFSVKYSRLWHGLLICLFLIFFFFFYQTSVKTQVANYQQKQQVYNFLKQGVHYLKQGLKEKAEVEMLNVLKLEPNNIDAHFYLGIIYAYHLFDKEKNNISLEKSFRTQSLLSASR